MRINGSHRGVVVTHRGPMQWLLRGLWVLAIGAILFVVISVALVPRLLNGAAVRVGDSALGPEVVAGDVVVARGIAPDEGCSLKVNDVVVYLPKAGSAESVTRRVVSKSVGQFPDGTRCRLIVRGGTQSEAESTISPIQVRGTMAYRIPKLGLAQDWAEDHTVLAASAVGTVLLGSWLVSSPSKLKISGSYNPKPDAKNAGKKSHFRKANPTPAQPALAAAGSVPGVLPVSGTSATGAISSSPTPAGSVPKVGAAKVTPAPGSPAAIAQARAAVLLQRENQIYEHEIALREARLAYRETCLSNPRQGRHLTGSIPVVNPVKPGRHSASIGGSNEP